MKVKSLNGDNSEYIVCQIKRAAGFHAQATEALPDWEQRSYGSAFTTDASGMVMDLLAGIGDNCYLARSLYDGNSTYIMAQVRVLDKSYDFQVLKLDGKFIGFQIER